MLNPDPNPDPAAHLIADPDVQTCFKQKRCVLRKPGRFQDWITLFLNILHSPPLEAGSDRNSSE
jgi:hypothetical protein